MARRWRVRVGASVVLAVAAALSGCTTMLEPASCAPGSHTCNGESDVRFCQYTAVAVKGDDCAALELEPSRPFCVASETPCIDTHYAVRNRRCEVVRYRLQFERATSECPRGVPVLADF